ncbi:hypothetical protein QFZ34_003705 [Phyllobacterium ifriqiyense]|uniref:Uncharacterized protein n=1 Tax=Phyllobacterium ifriqiyense TaxID=314238 RepID=A0ABU0SCN4_9HYPH|nr:hypothetical protein [Phyllobacterium ifriqiyense]MDQ0998523.1 hypothetical protein [Phyllobacterium ifriqiyense]
MGFVIAFPGSARTRSNRDQKKRQATAEITIFPGVRYEHYSAQPQKRDKAKLRRQFFDNLPQPG